MFDRKSRSKGAFIRAKKNLERAWAQAPAWPPEAKVDRAICWFLAAASSYCVAALDLDAAKNLRPAYAGWVITDGGAIRCFLPPTERLGEFLRSLLSQGSAVSVDIVAVDPFVGLTVVREIAPFLEPEETFSASIWIILPEDRELTGFDAQDFARSVASVALAGGGPRRASENDLDAYRLFKECVRAWERGAI